jgi:hypothetical protein
MRPPEFVTGGRLHSIETEPSMNTTLDLIDVDNVCAKLDASIEPGLQGTGAADIVLNAIYINMRKNRYGDAEVTKLWISLRMAVPRLVLWALDGDQEATSILNAIRRHLDSTIEVPWQHLRTFGLNTSDDPCPDGEMCDALHARLSRLWDDAMRRAKAL